MTIQQLLEFLRSFRLELSSINPPTLNIIDLNPTDNQDVTGKVVIDIPNKKLSVVLNIDVKF